MWGQIDFSQKWERDYELTLAIYADYVCEIQNITENDCPGFNKSLDRGDAVKSSLIPGGVGAEEEKGGKRKNHRNRHGGHEQGQFGNFGNQGYQQEQWGGNQGFGGFSDQGGFGGQGYGNQYDQQWNQGGFNNQGYGQGGYGQGGFNNQGGGYGSGW